MRDTELYERILGLEDQAQAVMHRAVERGQRRKAEAAESEPVQRVGVDEKAFRKGHRYITVVCDLDRDVVEHVAEDRTIESALSRALAGEASCGCFGAVEINPGSRGSSGTRNWTQTQQLTPVNVDVRETDWQADSVSMISRSISNVNRLCLPVHGTSTCLTPCSGQWTRAMRACRRV